MPLSGSVNVQPDQLQHHLLSSQFNPAVLITAEIVIPDVCGIQSVTGGKCLI